MIQIASAANTIHIADLYIITADEVVLEILKFCLHRVIEYAKIFYSYVRIVVVITAVVILLFVVMVDDRVELSVDDIITTDEVVLEIL